MRVLLLALGLLALGSDLGCDAFFWESAERGSCRAKNPTGRGYVDGTCTPKFECEEAWYGILLFNLPVYCSFSLFNPIVCCPNPASGSGGRGGGGGRRTTPGPHVPLIPHLPPRSIIVIPLDPQGNRSGPKPQVTPQPFPSYNVGSGIPAWM
ncbi:uncharacterized protein LOC142577756 [Dermacentor variabilis]|uniref:uncharacterized protein LOC142577756 n=1 Tax=Dermacentor variabilis TaxID=34621 RepID=UPI003F5C4F7C